MPVQIIKKKFVIQAVEALRKLNENFFEDSSKKKPLLLNENESPIYLSVQLKKIPKLKLMKKIKIQLPHRLLKDTSDVCLIAGDLNKKDHKAEIEPDIAHYKELLEKHGINCISEVVTLRQLRTEYKPYEAKQKLLAGYDCFLNDNRITECLPKVLGRHFFRNRKFPIQINMKRADLKQQVEKALSTLIFYVTGHGNSCSAEVAYLDMDDSEIVKNVTAVIDALYSHLPGGWDNVMGVYLKLARSKAIPIYVSYDDPNKVKIEDEVEDDSYEMDELSSLPNVNIKVYKNGRVETVRIKEESPSDDVKSKNENSAIDPEGNMNVIEKKARKKEKSSQELLTLENGTSESAVQNNESKVKKEKLKGKKLKSAIKQQHERSLLVEEKIESPSTSMKKGKNEHVQTKTLNRVKENKKDSENDTENKVTATEKKSRKKKKSCQELVTLENGTSELDVQNNKSKENKEKVEGKKLKSALKRQRERSLLMGEKMESFSPSAKKKKIEDVQTKKLNSFKENKRGKKKKGNHL